MQTAVESRMNREHLIGSDLDEDKHRLQMIQMTKGNFTRWKTEEKKQAESSRKRQEKIKEEEWTDRDQLRQKWVKDDLDQRRKAAEKDKEMSHQQPTSSAITVHPGMGGAPVGYPQYTMHLGHNVPPMPMPIQNGNRKRVSGENPGAFNAKRAANGVVDGSNVYGYPIGTGNVPSYPHHPAYAIPSSIHSSQNGCSYYPSTSTAPSLQPHPSLPQQPHPSLPQQLPPSRDVPLIPSSMHDNQFGNISDNIDDNDLNEMLHKVDAQDFRGVDGGEDLFPESSSSLPPPIEDTPHAVSSYSSPSTVAIPHHSPASFPQAAQGPGSAHSASSAPPGLSTPRTPNAATMGPPLDSSTPYSYSNQSHAPPAGNTQAPPTPIQPLPSSIHQPPPSTCHLQLPSTSSAVHPFHFEQAPPSCQFAPPPSSQMATESGQDGAFPSMPQHPFVMGFPMQGGVLRPPQGGMPPGQSPHYSMPPGVPSVPGRMVIPVNHPLYIQHMQRQHYEQQRIMAMRMHQQQMAHQQMNDHAMMSPHMYPQQPPMSYINSIPPYPTPAQFHSQSFPLMHPHPQ